jgi:hypothetical protein
MLGHLFVTLNSSWRLLESLEAVPQKVKVVDPGAPSAKAAEFAECGSSSG